MDTSTIDQAYQQLQNDFEDVANSIQMLAQKLQAAGDPNAREWLLDLKGIALDVKDERVQVNGLLQAIHGFVDNSHQQPQQMGGGMLGGFLNSRFGRTMELGAGIGLGEDPINSIF